MDLTEAAPVVAWTLLALLILCVGCVRAAAPEGEAPAPQPPGEGAPLEAGEVAARKAERASERRTMVREQLQSQGISDPTVLAAMRAVPRHHFVQPELAHEAYADGALPIAAGQTISQPYIVALMTQCVDLQPGEKVLEIGTGSGYQAAVLAEITPHVFSIEIVEELARQARVTLDRLGYRQVVSKVGDGYQGWPEHAPFDAILVTAAPDHVPPALVAQLAPGGRLCLPVGEEWQDQVLELYLKREDGTLERQAIAGVRFVPMTGQVEEH